MNTRWIFGKYAHFIRFLPRIGKAKIENGVENFLFSTEDVPLAQYAADASTIRLAVSTQAVSEATILAKMTRDYPHFAEVSLEEAMMNLLFEADIVNREIHRQGVVSRDGLSYLSVIPSMGGMQVIAGISTGPDKS